MLLCCVCVLVRLDKGHVIIVIVIVMNSKKFLYVCIVNFNLYSTMSFF